MDILDDMGVSKLSAKVFFFFKVNYSFKCGLSVQILFGSTKAVALKMSDPKAFFHCLIIFEAKMFSLVFLLQLLVFKLRKSKLL